MINKLSNYCSTVRQNSTSQSRIKTVYKIGKDSKDRDKNYQAKIRLSEISQKIQKQKKKSIHVKANQHTRSQYIHQIETKKTPSDHNRSRDEYRKRRTLKNNRSKIFRNVSTDLTIKPNFQVRIIDIPDQKNQAIKANRKISTNNVNEEVKVSKIPKIRKEMIQLRKDDFAQSTDNADSIISGTSKPKRSGSVSKLKQPTEVSKERKRNSFLVKDTSKESFGNSLNNL